MFVAYLSLVLEMKRAQSVFQRSFGFDTVLHLPEMEVTTVGWRSSWAGTILHGKARKLPIWSAERARLILQLQKTAEVDEKAAVEKTPHEKPSPPPATPVARQHTAVISHPQRSVFESGRIVDSPVSSLRALE